jgi:hypothetical protein
MSIWIDALRPPLVTAAGMDGRDKLPSVEKNPLLRKKYCTKIDTQKCGEENCSTQWQQCFNSAALLRKIGAHKVTTLEYH